MDQSSWYPLFADELFKFGLFILFAPHYYALLQIRNGNFWPGVLIVFSWFPIHASFLWWLHHRKLARLWITSLFSILVFTLLAVLNLSPSSRSEYQQQSSSRGHFTGCDLREGLRRGVGTMATDVFSPGVINFSCVNKL